MAIFVVDTEGWRAISTNSIVKQWGSMREFMHAHGLRFHRPGDYEEALSIIDELKKQQWREMSLAQREAARAHQAKYKY